MAFTNESLSLVCMQHRCKEEGFMGDFFSFRRMITPVIIQVVFWLGLIVIVGYALAILIAGEEAWVRVLGVVYLILGPVLWRVWCEIMILLFRISETLTDIRNNTKAK